jgi:hypothetical protein
MGPLGHPFKQSVSDVGNRDILRNNGVEEEHKILNTTGIFTINVLFSLVRIHY